MSFFKTKCPWCNEEYTHLFVGTTLYSGHNCPRKNDPCPCGADSLITGEHTLDCDNHPLNKYSYE